MTRILVAFGTTHGHTAKVAHAIGDAIRRAGAEADVMEVGTTYRQPALYDGVVVAASIHGGRYQKLVRRWVRSFRDEIAGQPTAFVSVCLGVLQHDSKVQATLDDIAERFYTETGWRPSMFATLAGALPYTRYNWITRWIMRRIAAKAGGDVDTTRDYEYTDWTQVATFAAQFTRVVAERAERRRSAVPISPAA